MASFCKSCGSELSPGAAFCEECGKPTAAKQAAANPERKISAPSPTPSFHIKPKLLRLLGIGLVVLTAAGGGFYFLFREAPPPEGEALAKLVNSDEKVRLDRTCLSNFDYAKNPVNVAIHDLGTKEWMDFLVKSEIYSGPRKISQSRGYFYEEFWQYAHAPAGTNAIKGKRLCFASGISVDRVVYQEINRQGKYPSIVGRLTYSYADQAPWSKTEDARRIGPEQLAENHETQIFLHLKDGQWERGEPSKNDLRERTGNQIGKKEASTSPGWLDQMLSIFKPSPESTIIGKWHADIGLVSLSIEFKPGALVLNGMEQEVKYHQEGKAILISSTNNDLTGLSIEKISDDELRMNQGGIKFILKRDR